MTNKDIQNAITEIIHTMAKIRELNTLYEADFNELETNNEKAKEKSANLVSLIKDTETNLLALRYKLVPATKKISLTDTKRIAVFTSITMDVETNSNVLEAVRDNLEVMDRILNMSDLSVNPKIQIDNITLSEIVEVEDGDII